MIAPKVTAMESWGFPKSGFCLVMDTLNVVHTTKNKVDYNLWGLHQESGGVFRGKVCPQGGYPI